MEFKEGNNCEGEVVVKGDNRKDAPAKGVVVRNNI